MSPTPQSEPSAPMISYSIPPYLGDTPRSSTSTSRLQATLQAKQVPRSVRIVSDMSVPEMSWACSKEPSRKLRVGRMPSRSSPSIPPGGAVQVHAVVLLVIVVAEPADDARRLVALVGADALAPVGDDGLEVLAAHDRAQPGAPVIVAQLVGDGGIEDAVFAGDAGLQDANALVAQFFDQPVLDFTGQLAPIFGRIAEFDLSGRGHRDRSVWRPCRVR